MTGSILSTSSWTCPTCKFRNPTQAKDICGGCLEPQQPQPLPGPSFVAVVKRKVAMDTNNPLTLASAAATGGGVHPPSGTVVWLKKPPSRGSATNTIWIRKWFVSEMIGHGGKNQQSLIRESGVTAIYAFQDKLDSHGWCPIEIQGNSNAFKKAVV